MSEPVVRPNAESEPPQPGAPSARLPYEKPAIIYEGQLEVATGSPLSAPPFMPPSWPFPPK